jgi:TolB-like protein/Tfp pilus assembly protein PilF
MSQDRQLAAIMFTDIAGYTALMGRDEKRAFEILKKNREIQRPLIEKFHGKWIKELGDGVMASFHTVTDAVFCAAAIHQVAQNVEDLKLRIGIHLGEVVFEDNDVFGDGVNIASRLQALASIGSTWVSEAVYKNLANKKEITSEFIKEEYLKNVSEPVKVYEINVKEIPGFLPDDVNAYKINTPSKAPGKNRKPALIIAALSMVAMVLSYFLFVGKSTSSDASNEKFAQKAIAVLPFKLIGKDEEGRYIADGVADELINHLNNIENLRVRSRTSVERYVDSKKTIPEIAEELKVDYILEGSAQKYKDDIRIIVQLINANTDEHLWQTEYNRKFEDIFKVQSEIALNIFSHLNIAITGKQKHRIERIPTSSKEAWDLFLRGKEYMKTWWKFHEMTDMVIAEDFFSQSVKKDSLFALGYAWQALAKWNKGDLDSIVMLTGKSLKLDPDLALNYEILSWYADQALKDYKKALEYADKAIMLEPANPDHFHSKGTILQWHGNVMEALSYFGQALKKEPSEYFPYLLSEIGWSYQYINEFDFSEIFHKKAFQLQPDNISILYALGRVRYLKGDYEDYFRTIQKIQGIRKDNSGLEALGRYYMLKGNYLEAEKYYSQYFSLPKEKLIHDGERSAYAFVLHKVGKEKEALKQIYEVKELIEKYYTDPNYDLAKVYSFLGEKEKALDYLSKWKANWGLYYYVEIDPLFENIRKEPEFKRQVKRIQAEFDEIKKEAHARIKAGEFPSPEMIVQ